MFQALEVVMMVMVLVVVGLGVSVGKRISPRSHGGCGGHRRSCEATPRAELTQRVIAKRINQATISGKKRVEA